ncbi:MAG: hypothetical protein MUF53_06715 [Gemmatimonadaceae bacterium]|nr:hypothetical protein [Gemmatimonadaceae bacterium]
MPARVAAAQDVRLGTAQNPPDVTWRAVEGRAARVIAPAALEAEAQRLAALLDRLAVEDTASLAGRPRRIDVVLQQRLAQANGFVSLFPRRTEWFLQPPQGDGLQGPLDWMDLLAVHEYRHVKQFDVLDAGVTRAFSRWLGEFAWAGFVQWTTPAWLLEGDAVATETAITTGGRGRMPTFDAEWRARLLEAPDPGYWTMLHRSFRDYWPNHYVHGWALVREARTRFGGDVWARAMRASTRRAFNPWALSAALSRETGRGVTGLHRELVARAQAQLRADVAARPMTPVTVVGAPPRDWRDDEFPQWVDDSSLVVLQTGLDVLPTFVRLRPGRASREVLQSPGPIAAGVPPAVGGGRLTWVEQRFDPRWGYQSWSVVVSRPIAAGDAADLRDTTRWTAVAMAPSGDRLAVVEQGADRASALLLLDVDGAVTHRWPVPAFDLLVSPRFSRDGQDVFVVRIRRGAGRRVERCPVDGSACVPIGEFTTAAVQAPSGDRATVFATMPVAGRDEVVAWRDGRWWQVTSRPVGATNPVPSPDGTRLAFNDQTALGKRAVIMALDSARWRPLRPVPWDSLGLVTLVAQERGTAPLAAPSDAAPYPVRDYAPWRHAWNPYGVLVNAPPLSPIVGAAVYSQDVLGTVGASIGAEFNVNERQAGARAALSWAGRYPIVDADVATIGRRDAFPSVETAPGQVQPAGEWTWREQSAGLGVRVPLTLTRDLYQTFVSLQASVRETRVGQSSLPPWFVSDEGTVRPVTLGLAAGRGYQWLRDLQPVWGQYVTAFARQTPIGGSFAGRHWFARARLFTPGLLRHHGLRLDGAWEWQLRRERAVDPLPYRFASAMPFARGYDAVSAPGLVRWAADYVFPLWYPDRNVLQTLHLRRVRGAVFADHLTATRRVFVGATAATAVPQDQQRRFRSVGAELWVDTRWWHQPIDIPIGVRYSWRLDAVGAPRPRVELVAGLEF